MCFVRTFHPIPVTLDENCFVYVFLIVPIAHFVITGDFNLPDISWGMLTGNTAA